MFSPYSFLWRKQNPLNKHAFYNQWFLFWSAPAGPPGLLKSIQFWPSAEIFVSDFKKAVKCQKMWIFSLGSSQKTRHRLCSTVTNNNAEPNVVQLFRPWAMATGEILQQSQKSDAFKTVLWIQIHWIWIRIQNFWHNLDQDQLSIRL